MTENDNTPKPTALQPWAAAVDQLPPATPPGALDAGPDVEPVDQAVEPVDQADEPAGLDPDREGGAKQDEFLAASDAHLREIGVEPPARG